MKISAKQKRSHDDEYKVPQTSSRAGEIAHDERSVLSDGRHRRQEVVGGDLLNAERSRLGLVGLGELLGVQVVPLVRVRLGCTIRACVSVRLLAQTHYSRLP